MFHFHRLLNKEVEDASFTELGLPYFAEVLSKMSDAGLLLSYAPVVLEKDPVIGAQVRFSVAHSLLYLTLCNA